MIEFGTNIRCILERDHPEKSLTHQSLFLINDLVKTLIEKIMATTNQMILREGIDQVTIKNIRKAVDCIMIGELRKRAVNKAQKAVISYVITKEERRRKRVHKLSLPTVEKRDMAGLCFPIGKIGSLMMKHAVVNEKEETAAVYVAGICEYIIAEILDLSSETVKPRIASRHISFLVQKDAELKAIYDQV